jgi:hypothetical protein
VCGLLSAFGRRIDSVGGEVVESRVIPAADARSNPRKGAAEMIEKRKFPRIKLDVFVTLDMVIYGRSKNLSIAGMCIRISEAVEKGSIVHLQFRLPGSESVNAIANVAWIEKDGNSKYACGMEFLDFSNNGREIIRKFIEKHHRYEKADVVHAVSARTGATEPASQHLL